MKWRRTPAFIAARMTRQKSRSARDAKEFTLAGKNTGIFIATDSINMTKMTQCKPGPNRARHRKSISTKMLWGFTFVPRTPKITTF